MTVEDLLKSTEYRFSVIEIWDGRMFHSYNSDGISYRSAEMAIADFGSSVVQDWSPMGIVHEEGWISINLEISVV